MAADRFPLSVRTSDVAELDYRAFVPRELGRRHPLVVVHGSTRNGTRLFRGILPMAIEQRVALIAPTFAEPRFTGYQSLGGSDGPLSAARALEATLRDVEQELGLDTSVVDLLGFSGGAQFVHRYAMVAPQRVRRVVVASSGWYTFLDPSRPFPQGIRAGAADGSVMVDTPSFLALPVHVLVGERDTSRDARLRTGVRIDRRQGENRLARALRWTDHVEEVARRHRLPSHVSFDLLPDAGHSLGEALRCGGLARRTLTFLSAPSPDAYLDPMAAPTPGDD